MAIGRINATLSGVQPGGLAKIVPTSVAVGSGTGSVDANGNVTFSGASSISINGCFTSTYDNYLLTMYFTSPSFGTLSWRGRNAGTDTSATNYANQNITSGNVTVAAARQTGQTSGRFGQFTADSGSNALTATIYTPRLSLDTRIFVNEWLGRDGGFLEVVGSTYGTTTSFDSLSILTSTSTISGTLSIYGYN